MGNLVNACFRVDKPVDASASMRLFEALDHLGCQFGVLLPGRAQAWSAVTNEDMELDVPAPTSHANLGRLRQVAQWFAAPGRCSVELGWRARGTVQRVTLWQLWNSGGPDQRQAPWRHVWLSLDENVFLPPRVLEYAPKGDPVFMSYSELMVAIIQHLDPLAGLIGYEADWDDLDRAYPYWGLYQSERRIAQWRQADWPALLKLVDERWQIPGRGTLVYKQPLDYPYNEKIDEHLLALLKRNWSTGQLEAM